MLRHELANRIAARLSTLSLETAEHCTRHAIVDDLLPAEEAREIAGAFPLDGAGFRRLNSFRERKWISNDFDTLAAILGEIAFAMQAPEVVQLIAARTGLSGLAPDPSCYAGGLSLMRAGDFLNPHIDNSHNGSRTLYRRLNLLYYLGGCEGGELELWNEEVTRPVVIAPRFNRLVLMETNRTSWHSVAPILCGTRRCVSSYYFSERSPDGSEYYHVTSFTGRPEQFARRAVGAVDNTARQLARSLGARRKSDHGYVPVSP